MAKGPLAPTLREKAQKWTRNAVAAQSYYVQAVSRPEVANRWLENARAAADAYNQAMQQVIQENRWGNRMNSLTPDVWARNVRAKADRRVQGIQIATNKWLAGFEPIARAIDAVRQTLPPRGPKMSEQNIQRAIAVMRAIHQAALERKGLSAGAAAGFGGYSAPVSQSSVEEVPPAPTGVGAGFGGGLGVGLE